MASSQLKTTSLIALPVAGVVIWMIIGLVQGSLEDWAHESAWEDWIPSLVAAFGSGALVIRMAGRPRQVVGLSLAAAAIAFVLLAAVHIVIA